jgi:hypothetical protein
MTRRLPISCENCRQRKIRCTGSGVPCDTCRRRGFTSSCHFKRDVEPFYADIQSNISQETLLQRISALERLLQQNIDLTSASINSQQSHTLRSPVSDAESGISTDNRPVSCLSALTSDRATPLCDAAGIPDHGLGTLITSATGHVRYIPSNISCDSTLLGLFHEPIQPPAVSGFPFSFDSTTAHQSLLDMLPPSRQCGELISIFLDVFSPLFHILHDPTFQSTYTAFQNDPKSSSLAFLGLVFIALGLAVTALDKSHHLLSDLGRESSPAANIRSLAARYRSAAMKCLAADNFLWQHNLQTVQCLVLLIYAINHAHGPAWALLGTTLNIAVAIGCHVDPETLDVGPVEAEERRRAWAALMMLYMIQNTCLGNLTPFRLDNKVRLPADLDDEDILPMSLGNEEVNAERNKQNPTKMSYILFKFRLYRLATDICHLVSVTRIPDQMQVQALDDRIMLERNAQKDRFHGKPELPIYHQAHSYILDNYTNHLSLLLHRPCLGVDGQIESIARVQIGYERCEQAALAILSNFETLHSRPELQPYCWYIHGLGSFHAFLAISTLLVLSGKGRISPASRPVITQAVRGCLARFHETASCSEICSRACTVLDPLILGVDVGSRQLLVASPALQSSDFGSMDSSSNNAGLDYINLDGRYGGFDLNGWTLPEHLEHMVTAIPCEQWLSPAGFPWTL